VLGVLAGDTATDGTNRVCFAVADIGRLDAKGDMVTNRLVHMFTNEQGSGGPRRVFNTVTDLGRVLFLRAAKWAMGETLQPYQGFNIIDVTPAGAQAIKLSWQGSAQYSYTVQASADLFAWQTVTGDVAGIDGAVSRTLNIAAAPQTLYLRVARLP
jgi:hypothetical protein